MKKELIPIKSKTYIKRLVVEINRRLRAGESVYALTLPHNVKVKHVEVEPKTWSVIVATVGGYPDGVIAQPEEFVGQNGTIFVSRER